MVPVPVAYCPISVAPVKLLELFWYNLKFVISVVAISTRCVVNVKPVGVMVAFDGTTLNEAMILFVEFWLIKPAAGLGLCYRCQRRYRLCIAGRYRVCTTFNYTQH